MGGVGEWGSVVDTLFRSMCKDARFSSQQRGKRSKGVKERGLEEERERSRRGVKERGREGSRESISQFKRL